MKKLNHELSLKKLPKTPTGIQGFDEITGGGLPKGRPILVCGGAGCGKTLFAIEFLVRGATEFNEPGVFMSFEETNEELTVNVASLGFDLEDLIRRKKLILDHVHIERSEIEETGEYDLEALFIRLGYAIDSIGAKRVVLDTIESLFAGLPNQLILRAELRRLFRWLKDKGVTAIITGEKGDEKLTRQGLEEYVSDCVIMLDHRVNEQTSTRRLRIVKYRGSIHGTNEYPFLIDETGFSVLPVTSLGLKHIVSNERVSSGILALDKMLEGKGYYRGSTVLVSGTAGVGKTSIAAHFAEAACKRGERVLYFCFEESPNQLIRNMLSIGIDLEPWVEKGVLLFHATRPTLYGLEMHLAVTHKAVNAFKPDIVILDPINTFVISDKEFEIKTMLMRIVDFLKASQITALFTSLTSSEGSLESSEAGISSLIDTWILLRDIELSGERNRGMYVLKSRGMANSNQIREFMLTDHGVELREAYIGSKGVLTGSARIAQEAKESAELLIRKKDIERKKREIEQKRNTLNAQVSALHFKFESEESEAIKMIEIEQDQIKRLNQDKLEMAESRHADSENIKSINAKKTK
ncbi:MAG: KaiC 1 [Bacteroidetes bacterium GWF2_41_61]|nr:MAG: KaiC 1 [Bacteroidetes bacterium GWE2_40_15]OFY26530.1 MAG: KaiC 1 [Bacteroidetes bacterium GWF2_41_61]OFY89112.1 MAG: KaiC 1 [Bacteroidetes bacterium RIFOXYA12_FULL_40_10]HBG24546.1 KaiC 1 [Rikenellaceae bacterium]HBZ26230.1 KaiC 1 [Rikenellaceae bacterium]